MKKNLNKIGIFAFVVGCATLMWVPTANAGKPAMETPRYTIRVAFSPGQRRLEGDTEISFPLTSRQVRFFLRTGLTVTAVKVNGRAAKLPVESGIEGTRTLYQLDLSRIKQGTTVRLNIAFKGEIFDAIQDLEKGTFVIGERTTGIISEEGIYLDDGSGWYPRLEAGLGLYTVEITVPDGWVAVAFGDTVESRHSQGFVTHRFTSGVPFDGMAVVAGRYTITERRKGAILLRAVFFAEDEGLANVFLDRLEQYLDQYEHLFGFYPYQRFDIVENFFTTGYSFPTFTLLGKNVIKMGERALQPGYLDHELVHSWFGNYLYFRPKTGNWVEGLTTYFANYYAREQEGPGAARAYRFGQMLRYTVRVTPEKDYSLREFEGKEEDYENDIGYGKASMFFHLLSRMLGSDVFQIMIRDMVHRYGGGYVDWDDFRKEMEPIMRADLTRIFSDWLDHPGIPDIRIENAIVVSEGSDFVVTGKITQTGHAYSLDVPIRVHFANGGSIDLSAWVDQPETLFRLSVDRMPSRVELDPDYHILRRVPKDEIPGSLNAALSTGNLLVITPEETGAYQPLIDRLKGFPGVVIETATPGREIPSQSFLLIGRYDENPLSAAWGPMFRRIVEVTPEGPKIMGTLYNAPEDAVFIWEKHPTDPGKYGGIYWGNSAEALGRARLLPYYGWESVVVFNKGSPVFRWTPMDGFKSWTAETVPTFLPPSVPRLRGSIEFLTRDELKGRKAGTPEAHEAALFIASAFKDAGLEPLTQIDPDGDYLQPFSIEIIDFIPARAPFYREVGGRSDAIEYWPLIVSPQQTVSWNRWVAISGVEDLADKPLPESSFAVWIPAEKTAGWKMEDWYYLTDLLKLSACSALVIVGKPGEIPGFPAPYFDYPSKAVPWPDQPGGYESPRVKQNVDPLLRHAKNQAALLVPVNPPRMPIIVVSPEEFEKKKVARGRRWTLELKFGRLKLPAENIVGYLPATESPESAPWVVVGAHYDHLGMTRDGVLLPGAVDNAAGVSALIESAHLLSLTTFPRSHHIVFVAFSGEEWGLRGSQAFVSAVAPEARIPYMVNLDAVGGRPDPDIYIIGGSRFPALASIAEYWANIHGLGIGKNIDQFALTRGSDFWPFLEAGIPVIGIFDADYRKMDQPEDDLAGVHFEKLARISGFVTSFVYALASR
ncbi:MAG: M28 family peptidase [bacterium JZ-2024 1]